MKLTYIGIGAVALAALILGGCKTAAIAETKEIQTQRTADLVITLLNELRRNNLRYGLATACIGGGQGIAMVVEALYN